MLFKTLDFLFIDTLKKYKSTSTEWILYSNVGGLYLSWKDPGSNPFGKTHTYKGKVIIHLGVTKLHTPFFHHRKILLGEIQTKINVSGLTRCLKNIFCVVKRGMCVT